MISRFPASAAEAMERALSGEFSEGAARDIAFHLADWNSDAAFLVAVCLFPDRFTNEEIEDGVMSFMQHAPNHVAAAAKLYGEPVRDIFGVGQLESSAEDAEPQRAADAGHQEDERGDG